MNKSSFNCIIGIGTIRTKLRTDRVWNVYDMHPGTLLHWCLTSDRVQNFCVCVCVKLKSHVQLGKPSLQERRLIAVKNLFIYWFVILLLQQQTFYFWVRLRSFSHCSMSSRDLFAFHPASSPFFSSSIVLIPCHFVTLNFLFKQEAKGRETMQNNASKIKHS